MRDFLASRKPSPAMAVAFVALLAALSSTAIALPGTNSVDSGDIKNSTIRGKDIRNGTVAGKDVKDNGVTGTDVDESTLGAVPNATNAANAANATNAGHATNADHATSADNATNATNATNADQVGGTAATEFLNTFHQVSNTSASDSNNKEITANCPIGERALGGSGFTSVDDTVGVTQTTIFQQVSIGFFTLPGGFTARATELVAIPGNWTVTARVTCAQDG